ncbi:hypothetical protein QC763_0060400 [Podospora pseudopauciseta]|uniref:Uncharacterized protein n=1 Tax=Podospora pseudopauciseta TaxID=2093780 RepID=A0ABR0HBK7_9PEZI|nr:hypothetical protein QC763_0060400 [Podospora pseudopauciseta]
MDGDRQFDGEWGGGSAENSAAWEKLVSKQLGRCSDQGQPWQHKSKGTVAEPPTGKTRIPSNSASANSQFPADASLAHPAMPFWVLITLIVPSRMRSSAEARDQRPRLVGWKKASWDGASSV